MFDIESLMQQQIEPKDVRKKPKGVIQWLSYLWPQPVEKWKSEYTDSLQLLAWRGKYILDTAKVNYSFGSLHKIMEKLLQEVKTARANFDRVLLLGYGGGSAAEIIHQEYQRDAEIVGVEIDPVVIGIAKSYFYSKGVRILQESAFDYIQKAAENSWEYDVIIVDLFIDDQVPEAALGENFIGQLREISRGGVVAFNTMKNKGVDVESAQKIEAVAGKYFQNIRGVDLLGTNRVIICS